MLLSKKKVKEFLIVNGYDGLYNELGECACIADDLQTCGESMNSCIPGYRVPCDCGVDSECEFHISSTKGENND